jgi:hypothetical protein
VNDLLALALLLVNALVVAAAAWLLVRGCGEELPGVLETGLAFGLAVITLVAGAGVLLGALGGLGPAGFQICHGLALAGLMWLRRLYWRQDWIAVGEFVTQCRRILSAGDAAARLAAGLLVLELLLAALAALAHPVVYDALTYRLSRVGLWLQDGRVVHYTTDDPRLNYMPVVPDLMMAWLAGAFAEGYRLTGLVQAWGGALLLGATAGLARLTGLGRVPALGAAGLLFAMTSGAVQFTSVHTDLFVAGVFAAAFYLWFSALRRGRGSGWGGLGAGLALGAKGTVFYLAPGAMLWVAVLSWWHRAPWRQWQRTLIAGLAGVLVFAGPVFWRNWQGYGGLFGPESAVELHHGGKLTLAQHGEKLGLNLATSAVQLLDPNAQPPGLQTLARDLERSLALYLPTDDKYAFQDANRREWIQNLAALTKPDADVVSCGILLPLFFLAGLLTAPGRSRDPSARLILVWGGGVVLFVVTLHGMLRWHPWILRFLVLTAPWLAVVAVWWVENLPKWPRRAAWGVAVFAAATSFWAATMQAYQVGWQSVVRPEHTLSYFVYSQWREWTATLDSGGAARPLTVALPINRPLAAFLRLPGTGKVQLAREPGTSIDTAEKFLSDKSGWVIVPLARFMGAEGRVRGRTYLFFGEGGSSPYGLAAYRRLLSGEEPAALLYRALRTSQPQGVADDLLVRSWTGFARLRLHNTPDGAWKFSLLAPDDRQEGLLAAGETREVQLRVPANAVAQVLVVLTRQGKAAGAPAVELLP